MTLPSGLAIFASKNRSEHGGKCKKGSTCLKRVILSILVIFLSYVSFETFADDFMCWAEPHAFSF